MVVSIRSAMFITGFVFRSTSNNWFLKIIEVIVKHDLFDAM